MSSEETSSNKEPLPEVTLKIPKIVSILFVTIQLTVASGVFASLLAYFLPIWTQDHNENERIKSYLTALSEANIRSAHMSKTHVESGSPAAKYSTVVIRLWEAAYARDGASYGEIVGSDGTFAELKDGKYEFCYPSVPSLPAGECVDLDDFRFSEAGYIESFEINDVPVSSLAIVPSTSVAKDNMMHDQNALIKTFRQGTLISPDFSKTYVALDVAFNKSLEDDADAGYSYVLLGEEPLLHTRREEAATGYAVFPELVHRFENETAAVVIEAKAWGFAFICSKHATAKEIKEKIDLSGRESTCDWTNL